MNDSTFRATLKKTVLSDHLQEPDTRVLEELGLRQGETRVDIAVVNGVLHGYEIKSGRDTLLRLPQQVLSYGLVLDQATLVVAEKHLDSALSIIPNWWGVEVAFIDTLGDLQFETSRSPLNNPCLDPFSVAELLWRGEALQFLEELGFAKGFRSKSSSALHRRIVEVADLSAIRAFVRHRLKNRKDWKSGSPSQTSGD